MRRAITPKSSQYWIRLWITSAIVLSVFTVAPIAGAQASKGGRESITASPSSQRFSVNAGETKRGSMQIINDGEVAYEFILYARPYSVSNEAYDPDFSTVKKNTNIQNWVQFDKTRYRLEAGQKATVEYTLRIPEAAKPGGHYGVLFAETQNDKLDTTGVARQKRVGNLIYATVNGKTISQGSVKEFILPFWQKKAPVISSARVVNSGNVDFDTDVSTIAKDMFGRTKFSYNGDPIVLPETTRLVEMNWDKAPNFGLFKVTQKISFLDQKHENGSYILIAPAWFPIAVTVALIGGAGYAARKRFKRR